MKYKLIQLAFCFLMLASCGFKVVSNVKNYNISEIITEGDKKINYFLKNKLIINSNNGNENLVKLNINTEKFKSIKEKNLNNQITKYEINVETQVEYVILSNGLSDKFTLSKSGSYEVASRHSETLNNEKNLINLLINDLSKDILDKLTAHLNDL